MPGHDMVNLDEYTTYAGARFEIVYRADSGDRIDTVLIISKTEHDGETELRIIGGYDSRIIRPPNYCRELLQ